MRPTRRGLIAMTVRSFLVAAALGALVGLPAQIHAQVQRGVQIVGLYMTTEPAYNVYGDNSPAPPKVTAFPEGAGNVAVYVHYRGAQAHKTSYRVAFVHAGSEVRHGATHTFGYANGEVVLLIPADELQAMGAYKATLYVGNAATGSTTFSVIRAPTVETAYMITAQAWNAYNPKGTAEPPKAAGFPGGVASVGAYFSYKSMAKTDVHYVAVYDAHGKQVHRSQNHGAGGFVPDGSIAIILPADAGHYPKGQYRTDLYVNGAMVKSLTWNTH